jgi:hypothetical protein
MGVATMKPAVLQPPRRSERLRDGSEVVLSGDRSRSKVPGSVLLLAGDTDHSVIKVTEGSRVSISLFFTPCDHKNKDCSHGDRSGRSRGGLSGSPGSDFNVRGFCVHEDVIYRPWLDNISRSVRNLFEGEQNFDENQRKLIEGSKKLRDRAPDTKTETGYEVRLVRIASRPNGNRGAITAWPGVDAIFNSRSYNNLVGYCRDLAELETCQDFRLHRSWAFFARAGESCLGRHYDGWQGSVTAVLNCDEQFTGGGLRVWPETRQESL